MLLKNKDVLVALSIVLLNVVLLLLSFPVFWISIVITLPMVFFVPGYMFTEMLTHARELDIFHRLTLSLGLSLTLDILSGFLLNLFPVGLRAQSWTALLSCLTLLFALAVLYFRRRRVYINGDAVVQFEVVQPKKQRTPARGVPTILRLMMRFVYSRDAPCGRPLDPRIPEGRPLEVNTQFSLPVKRFSTVCNGCLFAFAVALVILSLMYAIRGVAEGPRPGFTQLWMLPASRSAQSCALNIGIRSFENSTMNYHAVVTRNGIQLKSWSAVVLAPNQTWEKSIIVTPTIPKKSIFVQIKLYRDDKPSVVYREVHTTIMVLSSRQKTLFCSM